MYADDIMYDDSFDDSDDFEGSYVDDDGDSGGDLFEDTGEDVQYNSGVSMDTLQDAIDSGNQKVLDKIASLGALTGNSSGKKGSGIGGSGAYRGDEDEDIDDEEYYDLQLDEGDADEVETEEVSESPGRLVAANEGRIQEFLDAMTQVDSPTGSEGELTVASYIEARMGSLGYTVQEQAFHEGVLNEDGVDAPGVNILAERGANSKKNRKQDIFLIVTHYDSKRAPSEEDPFANDKSGAAALLESARIVSEVVTDTDICFLFLSGEEDGGYGAQNFIASLSDANRSRITGVLNVDRVGYKPSSPYVLKTLTGEGNSLGNTVQQLGLTNDVQISDRSEDKDEDEDEDGNWIEAGQSSDGYIDERTAEQIQAAQAGELSDENALEIDTADYLEDGEDDSSGEDSAALAAQEPMPDAWSYLKSSTPSLSAFAGISANTVTLTQYIADLDRASYEETIALGLAEAAPAETENTAAEPQDAISAPPEVNATRVADTANVIAAVLAGIMDPAN